MIFLHCSFNCVVVLLTLSAVQGGLKMAPFFVHFIILPYIDRFSRFFYCQNQQTICNQTITIDPTTPQVCRYTAL